MPELPEVEHAARSLRRWLDGVVIERAEASATRVFRGGNRKDFERRLAGRTLERLERRGKYLLFSFDGGVGMLAHLGMTGQWLRRAPGEPPPRHSRARLVLPGGVVLHYDDPRMFGRIAMHPANELESLPEIRDLGPDPLRDGVDAAALHATLARTTRAVKVALMDGRVIAGIGNIQATEALFRARVHPARAANALSRAEVRRIALGIVASIEHTFAVNGDAEIAYLFSVGGAKNEFLIFDRKGEACPRCGREIEAIVLGGRTSAYCPACQPESGVGRRAR